MHKILVRLHRWVGLAIALFLVVAGLTGCVLAFYDELDVWTNPSLYRVSPPTEFAQPLDPFQLREEVLRRVPGILINRINLESKPYQASLIYIAPDTVGGTLENDELFVDPYTGEVLGARMWGDITQGRRNLIPFIFVFHESLALGTVGEYLFGIVALLWTLDCFMGLYLTFPIRAARQKKAWLRRWQPAWLIRWRASSYKFNFDLHRAGGLWVWAMLLVLAWSGVSFNLSDEVYNPVMGAVFDMKAQADMKIPDLPQPLLNPPISFRAAVKIGDELLKEQALLQDFNVGGIGGIYYSSEIGGYYYGFSSNFDIRDGFESDLILSAEDGRYLGVFLPKREPAGWQITNWIEGLHRAKIGGMAMKVLIFMMGLVVTMLAVTGIIIWWRKRKSRVLKKLKKQVKIMNSSILNTPR